MKLIVAPHPDDEVLGCGGILARDKMNNEKNWVLYVTTSDFKQYSKDGFASVESRLNEIEKVSHYLNFNYELLLNGENYHCKLDSLPQLELISIFERKLEEIRPNEIYLPSPHTFDQDHRAVFNAFFTALRPIPTMHKHFVSNVFLYEQPKLAWTLNKFHPNYYVSIDIEKKLNAMSLHKSQMREQPHIRCLDNVRSLAEMRGKEAATEYAEAFQVLRIYVK